MTDMGLPPELVSLLRAASEDKEDKSDPAQVVQQLRDNYAVLQRENTFSPGQIVRVKRGVEDGFKRSRGDAMIFMRDLSDDERAMVRSCAATHDSVDAAFVLGQRDCAVGRLLDDGAILEFTTSKRFIEPHPDFQ